MTCSFETKRCVDSIMKLDQKSKVKADGYLRPYSRESTASRLICEVKHVLAWIVVRWGTTREVQVL